MRIFKTGIFYLLVILIISFIIRFYLVDKIPPHLTPDEAALGYNAYSILLTGKDEHGQFLPIVFKSFGDYKPGLYVYLLVPSIALFGLSELSVRMPSVIMGTLSVFLIYLVTKNIFKSRFLPYATAIFACFNPWLIYFSRGAWEVNFALTLTLSGVYFFILSIKKRKMHLLLSAALFGLSILAYQGAKLSTAIVVLILSAIYFKELINLPKKIIFSSALVGLIVILPILSSLFTGQSGRLEVFSIFSYPRPKEYIQQMLSQNNESIGDLNYYLFHNEPYNFLRGILGRYFNHFSGRFLFFEGDFSNPRHTSVYQGVLLISDIIFILIGFIFIVNKFSLHKKGFLFILAWLFLSPIPSVLSRDQVHAVRALNMAIPIVFISAFGFYFIYQKIFDISKNKHINFRYILYILISVPLILSIVYFVDSYFVHLPKQNSKLWEYGYKQIVQTVWPIKDSYQKVVVQQSFAQPYIYFLFYTKYDPAKYQLNNSFINSEYKFDVGYVTKLENVYFEAIDWSRNRGDKGSLFVADTLRIPPLDSNSEKEFKLIKEIKYLDGINTAFRILEVKND